MTRFFFLPRHSDTNLHCFHLHSSLFQTILICRYMSAIHDALYLLFLSKTAATTSMTKSIVENSNEKSPMEICYT